MFTGGELPDDEFTFRSRKRVKLHHHARNPPAPLLLLGGTCSARQKCMASQRMLEQEELTALTNASKATA